MKQFQGHPDNDDKFEDNEEEGEEYFLINGRESKLTKILMESLGGNSHTSLILNLLLH